MNDATERLRAMLDERGVEWWDGGYAETMTVWEADGILWHGLWRDGAIELVATMAPEQAIEATLGSDLKAENAKLRELVRDMWHELDAATQYDAGGGRGAVCEFHYRMLLLGIEVDA